MQCIINQLNNYIMGYTTDFIGGFELNKPLQPKIKQFLEKLGETRRMKRNIEEAFGIDGEFYVLGGGSCGQDHEENIADYNQPPSTQPSLWCQWVPNEEGTVIGWDGNEKFYSYNEWLFYIINKILAPNGYALNGVVTWQGEGIGDVGKIIVVDNEITIRPYNECEYILDDSKNYMRTDIVLLLEE